jgi:hypothetical protein
MKLTEKETLVKSIQISNKNNYWLILRKNMDGDFGIPRILRKYFIAKAKQKYTDLKKESHKYNLSFRTILKKVIFNIILAYSRTKYSLSKRTQK